MLRFLSILVISGASIALLSAWRRGRKPLSEARQGSQDRDAQRATENAPLAGVDQIAGAQGGTGPLTGPVLTTTSPAPPVAGQAPFQGDTDSDVVAEVLKTEPPPLARTAGVSPELSRIVAKAMRKNRDERYASAAQLLAELQKELKRS